jgi:hypothetical protein
MGEIDPITYTPLTQNPLMNLNYTNKYFSTLCRELKELENNLSGVLAIYQRFWNKSAKPPKGWGI